MTGVSGRAAEWDLAVIERGCRTGIEGDPEIICVVSAWSTLLALSSSAWAVRVWPSWWLSGVGRSRGRLQCLYNRESTVPHIPSVWNVGMMRASMGCDEQG